jgi:hypothetical protein
MAETRIDRWVDAYGVMFWQYDGVPLPAGSLGQVAHVVQSNRWLRHDGERWVPANDWPPPLDTTSPA